MKKFSQRKQVILRDYIRKMDPEETLSIWELLENTGLSKYNSTLSNGVPDYALDLLSGMKKSDTIQLETPSDRSALFWTLTRSRIEIQAEKTPQHYGSRKSFEEALENFLQEVKEFTNKAVIEENKALSARLAELEKINSELLFQVEENKQNLANDLINKVFLN